MTPYPHLPHSHNGFKAFEAVARWMSFTHAADELNVTQSAVSRQIKQLEADLNTTLVIRHHRSITLTQKGEALAKLLRHHYANTENLIADWEKVTESKIVIKAAMSFAIRWLIPKLHVLNARYPDHEIVIVPTMEEDFGQEHSQYKNVKNADYDLLVFNTRRPELYHSLHGTNKVQHLANIYFLRQEYMAPVCSRALTNTQFDMSAILSMPRLHSTIDHHDWQEWLYQTQVPDIPTVKNTTFSTLDMALSACLSGQGATVTDLLLVLPELEQGFIQCPPNTEVHSSAWQYFCHCAVKSPIIEDLLAWLQQQTQQDIELLSSLAETNQWQRKDHLHP